MPQAIATIAAIASIASAGTGIVSSIKGMNQSAPQAQFTPPPPSTPSLTQPTPEASAVDNIAAEAKKRQQDAALARRQFPSLQEQTGGSLSPDYFNSLASQLAGVYGDNPGTMNPGGFNWMDAATSKIGG